MELFWILLPAILALCLVPILLLLLRKLPSRGMRGELYVASLLKDCMIEGDKLIDDIIVLNPENGMTSQIDHILLSTRGVFVVETKNLSGDIYGSDTLKQWSQVLGYSQITTNKFYSPVKQNKTHIYVLKSILKTRVFLENIVVFAKGNTQFIESDFVYTPQQLQEYLNGKTAHPVSEQERDRLYNVLLPFKENAVSKTEHVKNIRQQQSRIAHNLCPRCNGTLVLRDSEYGLFYGCSNYPQCKFTKDID